MITAAYDGLRLGCHLPNGCLWPRIGYELRLFAFEFGGMAAIMAAPRAAMI
jgi:hypothetical protein